jgi:hypothetical protein
MKVEYYPIVIPTLCRSIHLKRCITSLSQCTYAEQTELVIGLDYPLNEFHRQGYNEILEYLPKIRGFYKVTIFKRKENCGSAENENLLLEYVWKHYDACIIVEDDTEYAPCFLDFMNKCLIKYKECPQITSVGGYLQPEFYNLTNKKLICVRGSNAWGYALWREKCHTILNRPDYYFSNILSSFKLTFKVLKTYPAMIGMLITMLQIKGDYDDVKYGLINVLEDKFQIRPSISLVRNWGHDGSGEHCTVDMSYASQKISTSSFYDIEDIELSVIGEIRKRTYWLGFSKNPLVRIKQFLAIIVRYLVYRIC